MRANDLTSLLAPDKSTPDLVFRQGLVVSWNPAGGTNEIEVAGTSLTNLPTLASNELSVFKPGDAVGLLRVRSQYFVLGRIVVPGSASPVQVAGSLGLGDPVWPQWPGTSNSTDDELMVGFVQRLGGRLSFVTRTFADANTSGVFRVTINGQEVAVSDPLDGGGSGSFGNFAGLVDYPPDVAYLDTVPVAITGRVTAGTGTVRVSVRYLAMA